MSVKCQQRDLRTDRQDQRATLRRPPPMRCVIFFRLPNYSFPFSFSFCCAARCVVPDGRHAARHAAPSLSSAHQHLLLSVSSLELQGSLRPPSPEAKKHFDATAAPISFFHS